MPKATSNASDPKVVRKEEKELQKQRKNLISKKTKIDPNEKSLEYF
jgi:hypothetical protein